LQQRITESRAQDVPLMFWRGKRRMSLPGVQNKLGVYMDARGALWLPKDGAPTSHILKVGDDRHPGMVANEYFCMSLAKAIGLTVPDVQYLELPEPILLVQRYDRQWTADGGLMRTHQIDGCQALNLPPEQKYEEPHYAIAPPGATFAQLFKLCSLCSVPASAQVQMLQWLLFNTLIGNSDAHAKNLSFLVDAQGMRVAPLYDLVCGSVYGYTDMAQSVGGETNFAVIGKGEWAQLAKDCGVPPALVQRLAKQLLRQVRAKLNTTNQNCGLEPHIAEIIEKLNMDLMP
jgi:serine/threonine-protein kinase HipA